MKTKLNQILAEISAGELIDKITILEIKRVKITDEGVVGSLEVQEFEGVICDLEKGRVKKADERKLEQHSW